jgi:hypothetical protein
VCLLASDGAMQQRSAAHFSGASQVLSPVGNPLLCRLAGIAVQFGHAQPWVHVVDNDASGRRGITRGVFSDGV